MSTCSHPNDCVRSLAAEAPPPYRLTNQSSGFGCYVIGRRACVTERWKLKATVHPPYLSFQTGWRASGLQGGKNSVTYNITVTIVQVTYALFSVGWSDLFARCTFDSGAFPGSCSGSFSVFCSRTAQKLRAEFLLHFFFQLNPSGKHAFDTFDTFDKYRHKSCPSLRWPVRVRVFNWLSPTLWDSSSDLIGGDVRESRPSFAWGQETVTVKSKFWFRSRKTACFNGWFSYSTSDGYYCVWCFCNYM